MEFEIQNNLLMYAYERPFRFFPHMSHACTFTIGMKMVPTFHASSLPKWRQDSEGIKNRAKPQTLKKTRSEATWRFSMRTWKDHRSYRSSPSSLLAFTYCFPPRGPRLIPERFFQWAFVGSWTCSVYLFSPVVCASIYFIRIAKYKCICLKFWTHKVSDQVNFLCWVSLDKCTMLLKVKNICMIPMESF